MKVLINVLLRLSILYFLLEVLLFPDDPRFAGKAIPIRNFIIVLTFSLLVPFLYYLKKRRWVNILQVRKYPFWIDNIYLSIFWLDMAGNSLNLYDAYYYFDLIPHFHGTGALAIILIGLFNFSKLSAIGIANVIHMLIEIQEFYTDVFFGTQNVHGTFDVINDMLVGILGSFVYVLLYWFIQNKLDNQKQNT